MVYRSAKSVGANVLKIDQSVWLNGIPTSIIMFHLTIVPLDGHENTNQFLSAAAASHLLLYPYKFVILALYRNEIQK